MKRPPLIVFVCLCVLMLNALAWAAPAAPQNASTTPGPSTEQSAIRTKTPWPSATSKDGIFPLDISSKGTDACGVSLSYTMKEEIIASPLFELIAADAPKFILQLRTREEFGDRPGLASIYAASLIYQENSTTLPYYLDSMQGQVDTRRTSEELRKILEWVYDSLKRYHYLLE